MDAAAFVDKWRKSRRTERSASQEHFLDLCEAASPSQAGGGRSQGVDVHDGAPGQEGGGKARVRRRLEEGVLRLGVQEEGGGSQRGLQPTAPVQWGPREPAAAGRLGHGPDRDPDPVHRLSDHDSRHHARHVRDARESRETPLPLLRARKTPAREDHREDHGRGRQEAGGAGPEHESPVHRFNEGGPLPGPPDLLHVRRRCRTLAESRFQPVSQEDESGPPVRQSGHRPAIRGDGQGRGLLRRDASRTSTGTSSTTPRPWT